MNRPCKLAGPVLVEVSGLVFRLYSALQGSRNHYSTLKKCRYRYWILPNFVTFLYQNTG